MTIVLVTLLIVVICWLAWSHTSLKADVQTRLSAIEAKIKLP